MNFIFVTTLVYLACGIVLVMLGFLIFREDAHQRLNRITAAMLFLAALGPILGAFGMLLEYSGQAVDLNLEFLNHLYLIWEFFFPQLVLFSLVFPAEHPVLKSHPNLPVVLYLPQAFHLLLVLVLPHPESVEALREVFGLSQVWPIILQPIKILLRVIAALLEFLVRHHGAYFAAINMAYVVTALTVMHFGPNRVKNPRLQKQVNWLLWGIRASLGLYAIAFLLPQFSPLELERNLAHLLTILSLLIGSGAIAWAIIRYQFLDARFIVRRSFLYSVSSGLLVGLYLLVYGRAESAVNSVFGFNLPVVEVFFMILAVIFFQPILSFMEGAVEKFFFKEVRDYQLLLQTLSRDLMSIMDLSELQEKITTSLSQALMLENVHLLLKQKSQSVFSTRVTRAGRPDETQSEPSTLEVRFGNAGPFVSLMRRLESPIYDEDAWPQLARSPESESLAQLRPRLLMPLSHRGELVGILVVGRKITQQNFSYEDMTFLSLLSNQMAFAIENSRLYQEKLARQRLDEELNLAREIQRMLLPREFPQGREFEISAINLPSYEVGGDYYDFITLNGGAIALAIGDVSGKGIPGAILMSNLQAIFRASASRSLQSNRVMEEVNTQISRTASSGKYATFFCGILSTDRRTLSYTNAGHNYPILLKSSGEAEELKESDLIIGVRERVNYHEHMLQLEGGDTLVFYTDGVTEAMNPEGQEFGLCRLFEVIQLGLHDGAEELRNRIYEAVLKFAGETPQADDLTLVVLKMKESE